MDTETLTMTSFLRDTYVTLPKYNGVYYGKNRLNLPYLIGGFEMLNDCLEQNFGVEVDHNVEVDFSGFKAVIDALGGVDLELTAGEAQIVEGDLQAGYNQILLFSCISIFLYLDFIGKSTYGFALCRV